MRLDEYQRSTAPLIQFYRRTGLLTPVPATGSAEAIFQRSGAALWEKWNERTSLAPPTLS
jgi:adenylate kinase family enzyme